MSASVRHPGEKKAEGKIGSAFQGEVPGKNRPPSGRPDSGRPGATGFALRAGRQVEELKSANSEKGGKPKVEELAPYRLYISGTSDP